jgi:hypothetical protein
MENRLLLVLAVDLRKIEISIPRSFQSFADPISSNNNDFVPTPSPHRSPLALGSNDSRS